MVIKSGIAIVTAALLGVAVLAQGNAQATVTAGIDVDPAGNSADSIGEIQECLAVDLGDILEVDVFVRGLPEGTTTPPSGGLSGFGFDILYDPDVININSADADFLIVQADPENAVVFFSGGDPDSDGDYRVDVAQFPTSGPPLFESGDGVLLRISVKAVAAGITVLELADLFGQIDAPSVYDGGANAYSVESVQNATLAVDQACDTPPPLPPQIEVMKTPAALSGTDPQSGPGQAGSDFTPAPGEIPAGDGAGVEDAGPSEGVSLAVDAAPTGNTATSVASIEPCASAQVGDTFEVDLVIRDVTDLLAWEIGISYDPMILEVRGRDVQMFQAANAGSGVVDTSGETPDSSGRYVVSAVDTADPAAPDSGSGVLARITFKAIKEGASPLSLEKIDLDDDGTPDQGPFLRAENAAIIGDENGDAIFDGPTDDAEIRVGAPCPASGTGEFLNGDQTGPKVRTVGDGGIGTGAIVGIVVGAVAAALIAGGLAAFLIRRRRQASAGQ